MICQVIIQIWVLLADPGKPSENSPAGDFVVSLCVGSAAGGPAFDQRTGELLALLLPEHRIGLLDAADRVVHVALGGFARAQ